MKHQTLKNGFLVGLILVLVGCSPEASNATLTGQIVEAGSERPLSNVLIVAKWEILGGTLHQSTSANSLLIETRSDSDGNFKMPEPEPDEHRRFSPSILVYLKGYEVRVLSRRHTSLIDSTPSVLRIETSLTPITDQTNSAKSFELLRSYISMPYAPCDWELVPGLTKAYFEAAKQADMGLRSDTEYMANHLSKQGECSDPLKLKGIAG